MATFPSFKPLIDEVKAQEHLAELKQRYEELAKEMTAIERAREAATAYLDILQGRRRFAPQLEPQDKTTRPRASSGERAKRGELGGFRKEVYDFVAQHPKGIEAGDVQAHFNPTRDKKRGSQVSAALYKLKEAGYLEQPRGRGPYTLGPNAPRAATPSHDELAIAAETAA